MLRAILILLALAAALPGAVTGERSVLIAKGTLPPTSATRWTSSYYVDATLGADSNSGTSTAAPWATLAKVAAVVGTNSNVRVYLKCGSTWREQLRLTGTVRVESYSTGALPIIDGADLIPGADWSKTGGLTSVYQISRTAANTAAINYAIYENGVRLTRTTSTAACDAAAGSFFTPAEAAYTSGGAFTAYVHASDNGNPASNGKTYEITAREWCLVAGDTTHSGAEVCNLDIRRGGHANGPLQVGRSALVAGCIIRNGADHALQIDSGRVTACASYDCEFGNDFYCTKTGASNGATRFDACSASLSTTSTEVTAAGFNCDGATTSTVTFSDCSSTRHRTGFLIASPTATVVTVSNCYAQCAAATANFRAVEITSPTVITLTADHLRANGAGSYIEGFTIPNAFSSITVTNGSMISRDTSSAAIHVTKATTSVIHCSFVAPLSTGFSAVQGNGTYTFQRNIIDGYTDPIRLTIATWIADHNDTYGGTNWTYAGSSYGSFAAFATAAGETASITTDPQWKSRPSATSSYFGYYAVSPCTNLQAGYPEYGTTWQPWNHPAEAALESAVALNAQGRAFSRASQGWDPVGLSFKATGVPRQRQMSTPMGSTFTADLIESAATNLATGLPTATYAATATATHVAWWDGGLADYVITASVGTPVVQTDMRDGRHWVQITGVTATSTITATRAGSPTNTHLQIEASTHPTTKIALAGSRAAEALTWSYGSISTSAGTFVDIVRPEGWDGWPRTTIYRHSGSRPLVETSYPNPSTNFALTDGAATQQNAYAPFFGYDQRTAWYVGTYNSSALKAFTDGYTAGTNSPRTVFTFPWAALSSGNLGAAGGGSTPDDSYIVSLYFPSVLPDATIADIPQCLGFDDLQYKPRLSWWGDSLTYGDTFGQSVTYTMQRLRPKNRIYNGGTDSETSTQIQVRHTAAPEKWGDITVIWAGRNDYNSGTTVKANIATMVAHLTTTKYVVLGVTNDSTQTVGTAGYNTIVALNSQLAALYPGHWLDARQVWVNGYNPSIPQDVTDFGNDVPPTSLRTGSIHCNTAGFALIATAVANFITYHGW